MLVLLIVWSYTGDAVSQTVHYEISFPNLAHHEAEIRATFSGVPQGRPLEVRMSRTSPGRYALHEFAKNVYSVRFVDGAGRPLVVDRPNLHQWNVSGHSGTVTVMYTLFGDRADGTYDGINNRYAHLNIPATFMWARGLEDAPITLRIEPPRDDWDVATQLFPGSEDGTFEAPNLSYFIDSPIHIGPITWESWSVSEDDHTYTMRMALHFDGTEQEAAEYAGLTRTIVDEEIAMWRDIPDFDTGTYTFIAVYLPSVSGDGMEHRNSTVLTYPPGLSGGAVAPDDPWLDPLGTVAHEFFHAWNVERMRPRSLEPFNLEEANVSRELWFAEGFTSYYDGLFLKRAGLISDEQYAASLSNTVNAAINAPGRRFYSLVQMSMQAPFVDAANSVDPTNRRNTFISYYTGGDALALGLDLQLRGAYDVTLDDYMRAMWNRFGKTETPYTVSDLEEVLGETAHDDGFARSFFERFVEGREGIGYEPLLARAGFAIEKRRPGKVWLGAHLSDVPSGAAVTEEPLIGSPLYVAGLERGSIILELDGQPVEDASYVDGALDQRAPGDVLGVRYDQNGEIMESRLTLTEDPTVVVTTFESIGRSVSAEMLAFRRSWLSSLVPGK